MDPSLPDPSWQEARDGDTLRPPTPRLLASTDRSECPDEFPGSFPPGDNGHILVPQLFRTVEFSADGTTLITSTWDHSLATYVLPQTLLDDDSSCQHLSSNGDTRLQAPIRSLAPNPNFSLADSASQSALVATIDHPIQLHHLFPHEPNRSKIASYKLINDKTEAYIAPNSMLWPQPGSVFLCGSTNRLDVFDIAREGEDGHYMTLETIPREHRSARGRPIHGWKGTIAALAASPDDGGGHVVAAGSWNRWVALYDYRRTPTPISHWCLTDSLDPATKEAPVGSGIVQTLWSPCGRYLILNERNSNGLIVYDIRQGSRMLGSLGPRNAMTQMRLGCGAFASTLEGSAAGQFEIWGGAVDGTVKMWDNVGGLSEITPVRAKGWKAHDAPVTNTILHPSGSVVVTSAGTWDPPSEATIESNVGRRDRNGVPEMPPCNITSDTSLRIWECVI